MLLASLENMPVENATVASCGFSHLSLTLSDGQW